MTQGCLSNLTILSIESDLLRSLDFEDTIKQFSIKNLVLTTVKGCATCSQWWRNGLEKLTSYHTLHFRWEACEWINNLKFIERLAVLTIYQFRMKEEENELLSVGNK
eukprot:XP_016658772.1 PREDICTED: uncharacterized protein LOC107883388 [Acyrthosiphon pisum]